jgi:protein-tyrosine kinase
VSDTELAGARLADEAADAFGRLWASLFLTPLDPPETLLVCSARPRDGATTVACALALAGAAHEGWPRERPQDGRVVLVDLNLRRPGVHKEMSLARNGGVCEVLAGERPLAEALKHVGPGKLDVLTAGAECQSPSGVLRPDRVGRLLADLRPHYGRVIVDAAPPGLYPDAGNLMPAIGSAVLVVGPGRDSKESLVAARRALEADGGRLLGVVLNMRTNG